MAWYAAVARWAPSKHNTQPWRFVVDDAFLEFRTDATRALADTDPQMREMVISTGAAVHLATVAARAAGYEVAVTLVPDGRGGGTARMEEIGPRTPTANDLDLLAAVPNRRTDRGPLDGDQLPADLPFVLQSAAAELGSSLRLVTSPGDRLTLADLVQRADRLLLQRGTADAELVNWLRTPTDRRRDGVPADHTRGPSASSRAEFVQRDFSLPGTQPTQDRAGRDRPLVGVLCTPADGVSDWLAAGRALGAVLLRATLAGANASYLNQPVEDVAIRAQLRDQLTLDGVAQLVLRIGVGGEVAVTPRRYLRDLIHRP
jgi:hypothetical protein